MKKKLLVGGILVVIVLIGIAVFSLSRGGDNGTVSTEVYEGEIEGVYEGERFTPDGQPLRERLVLASDGTLSWESEYLPNYAPIVEIGEWEESDGKITVTIGGNHEREYEATQRYIFVRTENGIREETDSMELVRTDEVESETGVVEGRVGTTGAEVDVVLINEGGEERRITIESDGRFRAVVPTGSYEAVLKDTDGERTFGEPISIEIKRGEITKISF